MHVRFVSPLSFSFEKNSTKITRELCPHVNIIITLFDLLKIHHSRDCSTDQNGTHLTDLLLPFCIFRHI